jgi:hypothetical protein
VIIRCLAVGSGHKQLNHLVDIIMRAKNRPLNTNYTRLSGTLLALSLGWLTLGLGSARANTVLWSEGFEGYNTEPGQTFGNLDKNASGANAAANGVGNPWFGPNPLPGNGWVTETMQNPLPIQEDIIPHSGTNMMRGGRSDSSGWYSGWDNDIDHVNLAYRYHGGAPLKGNFSIDWWFYDECGNTYPADDMDAGPANFGDHAGIEYSILAPANTDYVNDCFIGVPGIDGATAPIDDSYAVTARLAIGACQPGSGGCDLTNYQVQVLGATDAGTFGIADEEYGTGWFNTTFLRTNGWRHAAISVDGNKMAVFSIDGTVVLKHATGATNGFNVFTTTELQPTLGTYNQSAYYDDITLSLLTGPKIASVSFSSKTNLVVNATDGVLGWTYNVIMSTNVAQPLVQWTPISTNVLTANGPFTIVATNGVSAASAKRFYALRCGIQP